MKYTALKEARKKRLGRERLGYGGKKEKVRQNVLRALEADLNI